MRIAIFGAGAVGGCLAARLSLAGEDVVVFARGDHGDAIRERGLILRDEIDGEQHAPNVRLAASAAEAGPVDAVIVSTKAHHQADAARAIAPLLDGDQPVVFAANGIPWWYGANIDLPGVTPATDPARLALDPDGDISRLVALDRVIGCVIFSPNKIVEPGIIENKASVNRFELGAVDAAGDKHMPRLMAAFAKTGLRVTCDEPIRVPLWRKLQFSMCIAPLAALTGLTNGQLHGDEDICRLIKNMEREGLALASAHGIALEEAPGVPGAGLAPNHKNSMLQDVERGVRVEFEPAVGLLGRYAHAAGIATPSLDTVAALLKAKLTGAGLI